MSGNVSTHLKKTPILIILTAIPFSSPFFSFCSSRYCCIKTLCVPSPWPLYNLTTFATFQSLISFLTDLKILLLSGTLNALMACLFCLWVSRTVRSPNSLLFFGRVWGETAEKCKDKPIACAWEENKGSLTRTALYCYAPISLSLWSLLPLSACLGFFFFFFNLQDLSLCVWQWEGWGTKLIFIPVLLCFLLVNNACQ